MSTYVYVILDITEPYKWEYNGVELDYIPIYIGIGVNNRYKSHLTIKLRKNEKNFIKYNLIKRLINNETPPIPIKLIENISREEAKLIEINLIKKFGRIINNTGILTNITSGGDETSANMLGMDNIHSKKVYQYDLNGNFIKEWGCLREIERVLGYNYNTIGDCCRGKCKTAFNYRWTYSLNNNLTPIKCNSNEKKYKKVYKFDENGNITHTYESLTELCELLKVDKGNMGKIVNSNKMYKNNIYSYKNKIELFDNKTSKTHNHKIIYKDEILFMTNKEIMEMFNVGRYYITDIKRGRIKTPKFTLIY